MNRKEEKEKMRKNKGITLIALVITIIVLLILAGVSIATLTGENGILAKAQVAGKRTQEGTEKEQISVAYSATFVDKEGKKRSNCRGVRDRIKKIRTGSYSKRWKKWRYRYNISKRE